MPTRFPGDAQRARYGRFDEVPGRSRVARYFHLDATGRAIIDQLHGSHDRLGFALQPCIARFPGILPTRFDDIPDVVTEAVAAQLKLPAKPSLTAYAVGRPRKRPPVPPGRIRLPMEPPPPADLLRQALGHRHRAAARDVPRPHRRKRLTPADPRQDFAPDPENRPSGYRHNMLRCRSQRDKPLIVIFLPLTGHAKPVAMRTGIFPSLSRTGRM